MMPFTESPLTLTAGFFEVPPQRTDQKVRKPEMSPWLILDSLRENRPFSGWHTPMSSYCAGEMLVLWFQGRR